jgi:sec-independent protein translocase protein TatA
MPNLGLPEILIIAAVVILVFGIGKVADVGGALGRSIREFRRELRAGDKEDESAKGDLTSESKVETRGEERKAPPPPSGSTMSH